MGGAMEGGEGVGENATGYFYYRKPLVRPFWLSENFPIRMLVLPSTTIDTSNALGPARTCECDIHHDFAVSCRRISSLFFQGS